MIRNKIFSVVNKVLHRSQIVLPNIINSDKDMAHCINYFFSQKMHDGFPTSTLSEGMPWGRRILHAYDGYTSEIGIRQLLERSSDAFSVQLTLYLYGL